MKVNIKPDVEKARALFSMANITLERLEETRKIKYPSNTLIDYYDAIHNLMESLSLINGIKIKGEGAHQELINYICQTYKLPEELRLFLQNLRDLRNRIIYEGFFVKKQYLEVNENHITSIIEKLKFFLKR